MIYRFQPLIACLLATSYINCCASQTSDVTEAMPRYERLLDDGWRFSLNPDSTSGIAPFTAMVDLPHDWSVTLPFDSVAPSGNDGGYLPTGTGTYTKTLTLAPEELDGRRLQLMFEGVYERCELYVNGNKVGFRPYGYSSVIYDITPFVHTGDNEIKVVADNSHQKNCRWYSGSGIYRHVRLTNTGETHVSPWSLFVTTPEISDRQAKANVCFSVTGMENCHSALSAEITVTDPGGRRVANEKVAIESPETNAQVIVPDPSLWSPDSPALYNLDLKLISDGEVLDRIEERFGIRELSFTASEGFKLNGHPVLINGACVHHDNGILGAASFDAAEARKVRLLKEAGFNAVRTSHNPPSPSFLDECDRQGLLVIDEAFDGWRDSKNASDYSLFFDEWSGQDVSDMVRRDRNHPSVIAWSIGNEVIERKKIEVVTTARRLAGECRRLDPTRPVTSALCAWDSDWEIYDPLAEEHDIVGYNYMIHKSETDHERCPQRVMWQTESYPADALANWRKVAGHSYIIGDFVWTGIDYLGESGIGRFYYHGETEGEHYHRNQWPWHGAYCGDIDITGLRKPISHYRDMLYNDDRKLYMAVREPDGYHGTIKTTQWSVWPTWESWNWSGHEGKPIEVEVISHYPRVRIYLNGEIAGERNLSDADGLRAVFTIPYQPGTVTATGLDADGKEIESVNLSTAGKPWALRLTPDRQSMTADNRDLIFVVAEIVDRNGNIVPDSDLPLSFSVSGPGSVIAAGNADLKSTEPYSTPFTHTWKGRALVVVKSSERPGSMTLSASTPTLKKSSIKLRAAR